MTRIAMFLAALGLAALQAPAALAEGGGRDWSSPFKFEYSDVAEPEPEDDASEYSWLARGSLGGYGYLGVRLSDSKYFQADFSNARALDDDDGGASSGGTSGEVEFGSAFLHEGNVYFTPRFEGFQLGATFNPAQPVEIVEQIDDHDDWSLELSAGYKIHSLTPELRATYREAADKGERLGTVFYFNNRFRVEAGLSLATGGDQPEPETAAEPEIAVGTDPGFRGLFQRGWSGEFGHVAVRLSKYEDFRLDFSGAYVLRDDGDGGGAVGLKNPLRSIAGLFSGDTSEADVQRFGTAVIHKRNLYVMPDSLSGFYFNIDPARDIEVVEDYDDRDDWGVRLRVGYKFNELTETQVDAYQEAADQGRKFGDVYYDDNRFTIRPQLNFNYSF
ncbi:MAG: hypothetical protein ACE5EU_03390 [Paracoccaceae bacterium]